MKQDKSDLKALAGTMELYRVCHRIRSYKETQFVCSIGTSLEKARDYNFHLTRYSSVEVELERQGEEQNMAA